MKTKNRPLRESGTKPRKGSDGRQEGQAVETNVGWVRPNKCLMAKGGESCVRSTQLQPAIATIGNAGGSELLAGTQ